MYESLRTTCDRQSQFLIPNWILWVSNGLNWQEKIVKQKRNIPKNLFSLQRIMRKKSTGIYSFIITVLSAIIGILLIQTLIKDNHMTTPVDPFSSAKTIVMTMTEFGMSETFLKMSYQRQTMFKRTPD